MELADQQLRQDIPQMVPGSGSGGGGGGGGVIDATTGAIVFPVMSGENQVISGIQAKSDAAGTTEHDMP